MLIPSGYIPKNMHNFGHRYAENCHTAFTNFEQDQAKHRATMMMSDTHCTNTTKCSMDQQSTPLCPTSSRANPYLSHYIRNSARREEEGQTYRMSGYTGFVPKSRKYLGQGYPIISRKALQVHPLPPHTHTTHSTHSTH